MASDDADSIIDELPNVPSFSFAGCGFLGVYHVGVAACLKDHTNVVNTKQIKFAGASAGAIVATTLLCDINLGEMTKLLLKVARAVRERQNVDLGSLLRNLMDNYLPDDAHIHLRNRLYISVCLISGLEPGLITNFHSKEHLIECLVASSFVPGFVGWVPPMIEAEDLIDLSNGIPNFTVDTDCSDWSSESEEDEKEREKFEQYCLKSNSPKVYFANGVSEDYAQPCSDPHDGQVNCDKEDEFRQSESDTIHHKETYLRKLMRLCYRSFKTTSRVVRKVPGASRILDKVTPQIFGNLDGFIEALVEEMMSYRCAAIDGGFADNIPSFDSNTIKVCPFSGESDICPRDLTALDFNIDLGKTSMHASEDNIFRLNHALSPMDSEMLLKLCEEGYNECLRFLHKRDLLSCKKHLMTRATISSSPCNIGHAHCRCQLCKSADWEIRTSLSCVDCHKAKQKALVSVLPENVRVEFENAIIEDKSKDLTGVSSWHKLISSLWWCAEQMYAGSIHLADLAIDFYSWLLRFWDNVACFAWNTVCPYGQKRKFVRFLLSSLKNFINASIRLRAEKSCQVQTGPTLCS